MSAPTYFETRREPARGRSIVLAFLMHAVLLAVMVFGVSWQSRPGETVTVELWDPPPPPPPRVEPKPEPPPPPKVEPKPEPPKPEPRVEKPDIVEKKAPPKPKPKPEPKPKPKPEAKPAPPKDDLFQKKLAQEQLAMEQRQFEEERRRAEEARRKAEGERLARELAATARDKALSEYINRIRQKVRSNWILPQDLPGNPEAVFEVIQLPTGEVISVKVLKPSGNAAYDAAVERAILKSSPLPLPVSRNDFSRVLKLTFKPRD